MNQRFLFASILLIFISSQLFAQTGTIAGTIIDGETSESLIGATVMIEGTGIGAISDIDGKYRLDNVPVGIKTVKVSYVSFRTKSISDIEVKPNDVITVDAVLEPEFANVLGDTVLTIIYKTRQENAIAGLTAVRKNAVISDVVTGDIIRRTPDKDVSGVVKRMSAVTVVDGKFIVVRGLSDRYNLALVNGNLLPSTEPDRKTFSFDLIPSALLDNLFIYKTAQANLPGDFAGGIILMNTRDIPDENFISVSVGTGFNTLTTFQEYYDYKGGSTEWLGLDDGTRDLPEGFPVNRDAFTELSDEEQANFGKQFSPWGTTLHESSPLDQSYQLSGGIVQKTGSVSELGFVAALSYNNTKATTNSIRNDYDNGVDPLYEYNDANYRHSILWGGLANLSYKLNANNKISLKNSYTVSSNDNTTLRTGVNYSKAAEVQNEYYEFHSNQLFSTILSGEHSLNSTKLKINWSGGINTLVRNQPNYRTVNYSKNLIPSFDGDTVFQMSPSPFASPDNLGMFYSYMDEKTKTGTIDIRYPFSVGEAKQEFSFGGFYMQKDRTFNARSLGVTASNDIFFHPDYLSIVSTPVGELLSPQNFSDSLFSIDDITNPSDAYSATQSNKAVYVMLDNRMLKKLRISWGVRAEFFNQTLSSFQYGSGTEPIPLEVDTKEADTVGLKFDLLPSVNITYELTEKVNIRLSGSKTVARPELRELAPYGFYDIETNSSVIGNPDLLATTIYNADFRVEKFFGGPQFISASLFCKKFIDPIGQRFFFGTLRELKPVNDSIGTILGAEFELRKNLSFISRHTKFLEQLTFNTNLAIIRSNVILHAADTALAGVTERELQGQSEYVINFGLTYQDADNGMSVTLLFNQIGPRISEYGNSQYPNIRENPRPLFDAQISIPFLASKGTVKLNFSDVLSRNAVYFQDINGDKIYTEGTDLSIRNIDNGARISLSVNYRF